MPAELPSRDEVLRRIRTAIGETPSPPSAIHAEWQALPRNYRRASSSDREAILDLLEDRLRDYDAHVFRIAQSSLLSAITARLTERNLHRILLPKGLAESIGGTLPEAFDFVIDHGLSPLELNTFDGVLTTSTVAIAQTGTIVLQATPGQGRRATTLVPDYHLCIVHVRDVVETVPEAIDRLAPTASLATTFISGPSATADIEMTRIKGVHGPRFLDVLLVDDTEPYHQPNFAS